MTDEMDRIRKFVKQRLTELGLNMAEVSKQLGHNHAYLQQFIERGVPRQLSEDDRVQLAAILEVPEIQLRPNRSLAPNVRPATAVPPPPSRTRDNRDVPVWGTVEGGPNGAFDVYYGGDPVDWVRRFPGIETSRGIYALYVVGQSMSPAYRAGDLIYVSETKPPSIGCDVVIQCKGTKDGDPVRCFLKRLVRRTADKVVCEQFNPAKEVIFDRSEIVAMHRVLSLVELAGA